MAQLFGDFIEQEQGDGEHLKLGFHAAALPSRQRWRTNGLSANFLAAYFDTFFSAEAATSIEHQHEIRDAVSFMANELLENAIKFHHAPSHHDISIELFFEADVIRLYATNSIASDAIGPFQHLICRLLVEDPDALYFEQLERSAAGDIEDPSGLGLLTMVNDYGATLAWKFEPLGQGHEGTCVTTMVRLTL